MGQLGFSKDYNPTQGGTTPAVMQRFLAALFINSQTGPLMGACAVRGLGGMTYGYDRGVGVISTATGAAVITWEAGQTSVVTQPATARTDVIWANEGGVFVSMGGGNVPSNAIILDRRTLPAGATATSRSTSIMPDKNYALPYGASRGYLDEFNHRPAFGSAVPRPWTTAGRELSFQVPTDRKVDVVIRQAIRAVEPTDASLNPGSMHWFVNHSYNNGPWTQIEGLELPYDRRWVPVIGEVKGWRIKAGFHKFRIDRRHAWGGAPLFFGGGPDNFQGEWIAVRDMGVDQ